MKIAPLIHSRTFEVDFNSKFAVRPDDFTDADIEWARKVILPSTQDLDVLGDVRLIAASSNGKCIAGVACQLKTFAERHGLDAAEEYFCDNRGRFIKVFLGYSIRDAAPNTIPDVKPADLWQLFKEYLAPEWKRKAPETVLAPYRDFATKNLTPAPSKPVQLFFGVGLYEMSPALNATLFEAYLALALKQRPLAFCTNLDRIQPIEDRIYQAVTTTANVIDRLKEKQQRQIEEEAAKKKYELEQQKARGYRIDTSRPADPSKKYVTIYELCDYLNNCLSDYLGDNVLVDAINGQEFQARQFSPTKNYVTGNWEITCKVRKMS